MDYSDWFTPVHKYTHVWKYRQRSVVTDYGSTQWHLVKTVTECDDNMSKGFKDDMYMKVETHKILFVVNPIV